jgi:hypothetical protein
MRVRCASGTPHPTPRPDAAPRPAAPPPRRHPHRRRRRRRQTARAACCARRPRPRTAPLRWLPLLPALRPPRRWRLSGNKASQRGTEVRAQQPTARACVGRARTQRRAVAQVKAQHRTHMGTCPCPACTHAHKHSHASAPSSSMGVAAGAAAASPALPGSAASITCVRRQQGRADTLGAGRTMLCDGACSTRALSGADAKHATLSGARERTRAHARPCTHTRSFLLTACSLTAGRYSSGVLSPPCSSPSLLLPPASAGSRVSTSTSPSSSASESWLARRGLHFLLRSNSSSASTYSWFSTSSCGAWVCGCAGVRVCGWGVYMCVHGAAACLWRGGVRLHAALQQRTPPLIHLEAGCKGAPVLVVDGRPDVDLRVCKGGTPDGTRGHTSHSKRAAAAAGVQLTSARVLTAQHRDTFARAQQHRRRRTRARTLPFVDTVTISAEVGCQARSTMPSWRGPVGATHTTTAASSTARRSTAGLAARAPRTARRHGTRVGTHRRRLAPPHSLTPALTQSHAAASHLPG